MSEKRMPVAAPSLVGNEEAYVQKCISSTWISSKGEYVDRFEQDFAEFCEAEHAVSCCNGTAALHLALLVLGVGPGDEVLVPTLTFVATANAVTYCGARPVFVDSEPHTWNMNPSAIEELVGPNTKGIIAVHLYGHPADMDPIRAVADAHDLFVIEDAAEAHGARYKGASVGSLGDIGTFSFYGNKILTTGEGGMITTDDPVLASKIRQLRGQGMDPDRRYWFPVVGYNYRLTNVAAAIGLGQLENADWHIDRRRQVYFLYRDLLADHEELILQGEQEWAHNVFWMTSVVLTDACSVPRDAVMERLAGRGIETRPFFYPMHTLPPYLDASDGRKFPVADRLGARGINLPSWAGLGRDEVEFVAEELIRACSA